MDGTVPVSHEVELGATGPARRSESQSRRCSEYERVYAGTSAVAARALRLGPGPRWRYVAQEGTLSRPTRTQTLIPAATVLLALVGAPAAWGQLPVTLTLSRDVALWSDDVEARIEGVGYSGEIAGPFISHDDFAGWFLTLYLLECDGSTAPFSTRVDLGRLAPLEYHVGVYGPPCPPVGPRVQPRPPIAEAELSVHEDATLGIELPTVPTDAAPFPLVLAGPARSGCFTHSNPQVHGSVIEWDFDDNCPIIPVGDPQTFRIEAMVGPLPAGQYEVRAFDVTDANGQVGWTAPLHRRLFTVYDATRCVPTDTALCLQGARFRVEASWEDFQGGTGSGHAIPLADAENSGLLWFFSPGNVEVTVKVLNGCSVNGHWWVFLSSGSTVHYMLTVTDTATGRAWNYQNGTGEAAPLVPDTAAFSCP